MNFKSRLLWIDGAGGLIAGIVVFLGSHWLSEWYNLPQNLLFFIGITNLVYGSYSTWLATRPQRPEKLILLLVVANLTWTLVCIILAIFFSKSATVFGLIHLIGEGMYVGGLAILEWRWRNFLRSRSFAG